MDLLLILTYTGLCIVVFKVFKVPLNKWTVPTAVLGGIVLVGAIMLIMNYNHPYSENSREYFVTTPVIPNVSGTVVSVDVKPNQPLKAGDLLFTIDPTPFEAKVASLQARIVSARADFERQKTLVQRKVASQADLDRAQANFEDLQAQLVSAEFDLKSTQVLAPTDGYVTQLFLRPGMRAVAMPLRPVMVFVHKENYYYTAFFRQNSALRLKPGYEAEIALDGIPGEVFSGEVVQVVPALREGQLQPTGDLVAFNAGIPAGRVAVVINITDPAYAKYASQLPLGSFGQAAVYSEHAHHFGIIRRILLRMAAWMNYIYPLH
ncbi:HlyD family secretion protein [Simiduia curdlanivorans]|uniref:HlyD family secretion protein n=1 Tax=Simiduia curdlanivorans TaxID=1492769 RepID=A0ABV8V5R2_9GAMM|nr:HlyD family secretion protein [Simiduia curdlanivorans]MDN3638559.1 HlyD family secretion protein [Simiduia curdlanivorans]